MANNNQNGKSGSRKKQPVGAASSDLVYVKLPDNKTPATKRSSAAKPADLNDIHQKAESKRRMRAINPTKETW